VSSPHLSWRQTPSGPTFDDVRRVDAGANPTAGHFGPLAWSVLLAPVAGLVTAVADFYATPFCGQTFSRLHRALFLAPSLILAVLLSTIPVARTLRTTQSKTLKVITAAACIALIMTMPAIITVASLWDPVASGESTCEDH